MRRRRNGGGLIIGLSTSNMMSVGLPGISGAPTPTKNLGYIYALNTNNNVVKLDPSTLDVMATSAGTFSGATSIVWVTGYVLVSVNYKSFYALNEVDLSQAGAVIYTDVKTSLFFATFDGTYLYMAGLNSTGDNVLEKYSLPSLELIDSVVVSGDMYNAVNGWAGTYNGSDCYAI